MADPSPVTEEAFAADRAGFFHAFTKWALYSVISVIAIVALMGIFLG